MEDKMFELIEKIYLEVQGIKSEVGDLKSDVSNLKSNVNDIKIETKKNSLKLEDITNKIDILVEVVEESNNAHRRHRKRDMDYIEGRLDLIETAISNINPSVYKSHF